MQSFTVHLDHNPIDLVTRILHTRLFGLFVYAYEWDRAVLSGGKWRYRITVTLKPEGELHQPSLYAEADRPDKIALLKLWQRRERPEIREGNPNP